jgi:hypothetical protein
MSPHTRDYARSYRSFVRPEFGPVPADDTGAFTEQFHAAKSVLVGAALLTMRRGL